MQNQKKIDTPTNTFYNFTENKFSQDNKHKIFWFIFFKSRQDIPSHVKHVSSHQSTCPADVYIVVTKNTINIQYLSALINVFYLLCYVQLKCKLLYLVLYSMHHFNDVYITVPCPV